MLNTVLDGVITVVNSCITGVLSACGACITPVMMSTSGWFFVIILSSVGGNDTGTSSSRVLVRNAGLIACKLDFYITHGRSVWIVYDVVYCQVFDFVDQIVSGVFYCQIFDFFDQIVSDVIYCQICDFVYQILTLVSLCNERINRGVILFRLLFQHYLIGCFSNLVVG